MDGIGRQPAWGGKGSDRGGGKGGGKESGKGGGKGGGESGGKGGGMDGGKGGKGKEKESVPVRAREEQGGAAAATGEGGKIEVSNPFAALGMIAEEGKVTEEEEEGGEHGGEEGARMDTSAAGTPAAVDEKSGTAEVQYSAEALEAAARLVDEEIEREMENVEANGTEGAAGTSAAQPSPMANPSPVAPGARALRGGSAAASRKNSPASSGSSSLVSSVTKAQKGRSERTEKKAAKKAAKMAMALGIEPKKKRK